MLPCPVLKQPRNGCAMQGVLTCIPTKAKRACTARIGVGWVVGEVRDRQAKRLGTLQAWAVQGERGVHTRGLGGWLV